MYREDELQHYGVKGMKWGVRRARRESVGESFHTLRRDISKAVDGHRANKFRNKAKIARDSANEWNEIGKHKADKYRAKGNKSKAMRIERKYRDLARADKLDADLAERKAKQIDRKQQEKAKHFAEKKMARMEKQKYKDTIKQYAKEINAGEKAAGRIYNKITGADKIQAEIRYDMEKRAKVNPKWYKD